MFLWDGTSRRAMSSVNYMMVCGGAAGAHRSTPSWSSRYIQYGQHGSGVNQLELPRCLLPGAMYHLKVQLLEGLPFILLLSTFAATFKKESWTCPEKFVVPGLYLGS